MADQKCDLFEFTTLHVLRRHLDRYYRKTPPSRVEFYSLASLTDECSQLLSALASTGDDEESGCRGGFFARERRKSRKWDRNSSSMSFREYDIAGLNKSFEKLALIAPKIKRQILRASTAAVIHDQRITVREGELLRAVADGARLSPCPHSWPFPASSSRIQ